MIDEHPRLFFIHFRQVGAPFGSQQETALLKRMFNLAFRAAKVPRVPYIPVPRCDNVRKGFIERDGYERLLAGLPEYLRPPVTMAYVTGMRRGEVLSLRWESVDLLNRQVRLNPGETKNGRGRIIPLGQELIEMLTSQMHLRNSLFPECPQLVFFRIIKTKKSPVPSGGMNVSHRHLNTGVPQHRRKCRKEWLLKPKSG